MEYFDNYFVSDMLHVSVMYISDVVIYIYQGYLHMKYDDLYIYYDAIQINQGYLHMI